MLSSSATNEEPPRSQASATYRRLRTNILDGRFVPGERLKVAELAAQLEVSPGAVREALSRLVPEQLVVSRDQRGFQVAPLSLDGLLELTDLRCEIEAIALRRSVERGGVDWEAGVVASAHRLAGTARLTDETPARLNPEWSSSHAAFHKSLIAACGNSRLIDLHSQLYEQSERYRGLSVGQEVGERKVDDEHNEMLEAALRHDADALVEAVVNHIRLTTALITQAS